MGAAQAAIRVAAIANVPIVVRLNKDLLVVRQPEKKMPDKGGNRAKRER